MLTISAPKILDFDCETRPLSFMGGGFTTDEITAIAWSWEGSNDVQVECLMSGDMQNQSSWTEAYTSMLSAFYCAYASADIVTGHYIRKFDLPRINGALLEVGLTPLPNKMTCDTKLDLKRYAGISKSQENLGAMLAYFDDKKYLGHKEHMSQVDWRWANRLTKEGVDETIRRAKGDVKQHKELREALVTADALRSPRAWRP